MAGLWEGKGREGKDREGEKERERMKWGNGKGKKGMAEEELGEDTERKRVVENERREREK